jgi:hypothetical protein
MLKVEQCCTWMEGNMHHQLYAQCCMIIYSNSNVTSLSLQNAWLLSGSPIWCLTTYFPLICCLVLFVLGVHLVFLHLLLAPYTAPVCTSSHVPCIYAQQNFQLIAKYASSFLDQVAGWTHQTVATMLPCNAAWLSSWTHWIGHAHNPGTH